MIPEGWKTKRLGDVCIRGSGLQTGPFGSQLHASEYTDVGVPVVMPKDLVAGRVSQNGIARIPAHRAEDLAKHRLSPGDIVFARRGDIGRCVLVTAKEEGWICGTGCLRARPSNTVVPQFLTYALEMPRTLAWLNANAVGQTMLNLNTSILSALPLDLPPLPEQRRIAEILGTWDEAIALTERRIEAARQRKKGLMQRLLTGRVRFPEFVRSKETQDTRLGIYPEDWAIRHLSDVMEIRFSNVDKKSKPSEQPVLLCNYMDVFTSDYIHNRMKFMKASATEAEIRKFSLRKDDVIITKDSETRGEIAEPCVVVEDLENVVCGYHLAILRPKKGIVLGLFLKEALRSSNVHHQFVRFANGITRFGLTLLAVHNALVPVPSIEEQHKIAAVLQTCDREIDLLTQKRDALQRQKKGLMQRLLTGRVRVKV